jgi:hypothetical protein
MEGGDVMVGVQVAVDFDFVIVSRAVGVEVAVVAVGVGIKTISVNVGNARGGGDDVTVRGMEGNCKVAFPAVAVGAVVAAGVTELTEQLAITRETRIT